MDTEELTQWSRIPTSTVSDYVDGANAAGLGWPLPEGIDDAVLTARLLPKTERPAGDAIPMPDRGEVHQALSGKGVTLQLLWREYRQAEARGYGCSQFCEHYRRWKAALTRRCTTSRFRPAHPAPTWAVEPARRDHRSYT